jgi:26S proteasome non-ATPase regulatory subunit 5
MVVSDPLRVLEKYHEYMLQGFQHPIDEVRALVIAQLVRCVEAGGSAVKILCSDHQDLLIAAMKQEAGEDLGVAKAAGSFLTKLAATERGFEFVFGPVGTETLKQLTSDEGARGAVKFRVYETLCHVANISERHMEEIQNKIKLIEPLSHLAFDSVDDPLGQLNALEILAVLAETSHGLTALANAGVFTKVTQLAQDWQNNPLGSLLFPGLIKFVGRIGVQRLPPEELVLLVIDAIINSGEDIPLATVGIEALAFIGSTQEGKLHLDRERHLRRCFDKVRDILSNAVSEYRCRVLEALSYLFGTDEAHTPCLPKWFSMIFPQISVLFGLTQLPFADIRLKALTFLSSIAHLEWAQKHYLRSPGVIEFLTDRNIEPDKDCALAKFKIVSIIVDSATPTTLKILSPENMARLRVHMKQGPFYAPAQSTVAFEGSS